jgi:predicted AAA+ superfamily ATPase
MDENDFKRLLDASAERLENRFSYAELDRRLRTLEDTVADLQARVERLEQSPH